MVGFRKAMDYFPSVFSQKELFWLDNLMPASNKKEKKSKKSNKKRKEENLGREGGRLSDSQTASHTLSQSVRAATEAAASHTI